MISAKGRAKIPAFELAAQGGFDHGREARLHDYESPEEANGDIAGRSIGHLLRRGDPYEMLTTRRPMHRGASAPSASNPKVPKEIDAVVLKALAPNPASRFQMRWPLPASCASSIAVLDALGAGEEEELAQTSSTSVGRVLAMAGGMLLVAAVLAVVVVVMTAAIPTSSGSPELPGERRSREHLIDAGAAPRRLHPNPRARHSPASLPA